MTSNQKLVELVCNLNNLCSEKEIDKIDELKSANKMKYESLLLSCNNKESELSFLDKEDSNKLINETSSNSLKNSQELKTKSELEEKIVGEIKSLLDSGENVNSRETQTYKTLAHLACRKRNMKLLKLLIEYEADLEAIDFEFMTPIFEAVITGDFDLCKFLIDEKKINLEHKEIQNRTAFYWTACNGDVEMIEYLIKKGVDVNITSKMGRTPLSKASWNGKKDVVELLVKLPNIQINKPDRNGRYPIHNAVWGVNGGRLGKKVIGLTATDNPECARVKNHLKGLF